MAINLSQSFANLSDIGNFPKNKIMMLRLFSIFLLSACLTSSAQIKIPYQIYNKSGKKVSYKKMVAEGAKRDVVLFGEHHNNSIIHWLELKFAQDLAKNNQLILGAEMIEADNQDQLNRYLKGEIDQKAFDTLARLWNNHKTDYKPLVDFAKEKSIPFIATNVPRRYASQVFRGGFEALVELPANEKKWIADMPFPYDKNLPGYVKMIQEMGGHGGDNLPKAQAIKDATMAHFIIVNARSNYIFIHYNGTYHSDDFEGIYYYLKLQAPQLKTMTIATVEQDDITKFLAENLNKADFIIVVDNDMTKTY